MSRSDYDVVIVGAGCVGATLAIFLAEAGMRVLLLDRKQLRSDILPSTYTIYPPGIDVLDEAGVGQALRTVTPPTRTIHMNREGTALDLRYSHGRAGYCPQRKQLDGLLQDAAMNAGAVLLDHTWVKALEWKDGRVTGVQAVRDGKAQIFGAELVVGADGRHSTVAKLVGAEEYLAYNTPRARYWARWDAPSFWQSDASYDFDMYIGHNNGDIRLIFHTDDNQLQISSLPPAKEAETWRPDPSAAFLSDLVSDPVIGPLIQGTEPNGEVHSTEEERYYFRTGAGPGWALLGEAGHHRESVTDDGMTEALLQARNLTTAIFIGTDKALLRWWRARDVEALPLFYFGQEEGSIGTPKELQRIVFDRIAGSPDLTASMTNVLEHQLSPYYALPMSSLLWWTAGAAVRGNPSVILEFLTMATRAGNVNRELKIRRRLLANENK